MTGSYRINTRKIALYCRTWFPAKAKAIILFAHGAGEHSGHYSHVGDECIKRRIALVAFDQRGFGQSSGKRGHIHRFQEYIDDMDILVTLLQNQYPETPVYLFGHSLGGLVVIRYVQQFSEKAAGVLLTSPALGIHANIPKFFRKCVEVLSNVIPSLPLDLVKWNESLRKLGWFQTNLPSWTSGLLNDPLATIRYTPRWFTELLNSGTKALSEVTKFHFPALCLYDIYDPIINAERIKQFIDTISSQDKGSIVFMEGNHHPLKGHRRDDALEHIFQWLYPRL